MARVAIKGARDARLIDLDQWSHAGGMQGDRWPTAGADGRERLRASSRLWRR